LSIDFFIADCQENDHFADRMGEEIITRLESLDILVCHYRCKEHAGHFNLKLEATDFSNAINNFIVAKYLIKNIVSSCGKSVTFMPKPSSAISSSLGLTIILEGISAKTFAAGVSKNIKAINAFCNPFSNSFKKLYTNPELGAVRVISDKVQQVNFKFLDCVGNPYLAISSLLLAGMSFSGKSGALDCVAQDFALIFSQSLDDSLRIIKKDLDFCHNIFDKSLISNYITDIKCIERIHNFDISASENMLYYNM